MWAVVKCGFFRVGFDVLFEFVEFSISWFGGVCEKAGSSVHIMQPRLPVFLYVAESLL